jgi:Protein of unknown function (DUF3052)
MAKNVAEKLLIKKGSRVAIVDAPGGYTKALQQLAPDAIVSLQTENADIVQVFVNSISEAKSKLPNLSKSLRAETILWVAYPKSSARKTDINRDSLREYAATIGLKAVSLFAVDSEWSAMRFKRI